ncbi:hypothetical protein Nmel_008853 [Mimus melanotis]
MRTARRILQPNLSFNIGSFCSSSSSSSDSVKLHNELAPTGFAGVADVLVLSIENCFLQHSQEDNGPNPELDPQEIPPVREAPDEQILYRKSARYRKDNQGCFSNCKYEIRRTAVTPTHEKGPPFREKGTPNRQRKLAKQLPHIIEIHHHQGNEAQKPHNEVHITLTA